MKPEHEPGPGNGPQIKQPQGFFRDIEIEFLIHELKDPIAVIETGLRTLLEKQQKFGALSPRQYKILKRSLRNSNKARAMLNSLLEIGRSEAGCFVCCRFPPAKAALGALLEALDTVADTLSEEFRTVETEAAAQRLLADNGIFLDFGSGLEETVMVQDETKFRQIVGNLIKNALHHRKERIEIKMHRDDTYLMVDVADDGPGIAPEHHLAVFERYRQIDTCSLTPPRGHGLGLAGARIMARCLGGDIELQSQKGMGATFLLRLPLQLQEAIDSTAV
jgi:two-component system OmpR family sensor kinase